MTNSKCILLHIKYDIFCLSSDDGDHEQEPISDVLIYSQQESRAESPLYF